MTITLGNQAFPLDGQPAADYTDGYPFELGNGNIFYTWENVHTDLAQFAVYDVDGNQLIGPTEVDASTPPAEPDPVFSFEQSIYAAQALDGGGYRVHYIVDDLPLFPLEATHYTRDFDASGAPLGASVAVPGLTAYFRPQNSVAIETSTGQIAIASDAGLTILDADGSVAGGTTQANFFSTSDFGYKVLEVDGKLLVFKATIAFNFSTFLHDLSIEAQYYGLDGTAQGAPVKLVENVGMSTENFSLRARVDADVLADGRIVVVHGELASPGEDLSATGLTEIGGISATILNPDLSVSVPAFAGNPDALESGQYMPNVDALDSGGFVISYESNDIVDNITATFRIQEFDADANPVGASVRRPVEVSFDISGQAHTIINRAGEGLIIDETGRAMAVDVTPGGGGGTNPGIDESGGPGPDTLIGTEGDDTLAGLAGDDTIAGAGGDDSLLGGAGNDQISGSDGDDTIDGGDGDDNIGGGLGDDVITGGLGGDTIGAGQGHDMVDGGAGDDGVFGGAFNDTLEGGDGNDTMGAGFNDDIVNGGAGDDLMGGGTGRDTMDGGDGNDSLGGGEGNDTVMGGEGDDNVNGGGRHDMVDGGAGDDQVNGGAGSDIMTGGAGDDLFVFNEFEANAVDVITDWTDGEDMFRMTGIQNAPGTGLAGKLAALDATQVSGNVHMTYDGNTIILENADVTDLGLEDFIFL